MRTAAIAGVASVSPSSRRLPKRTAGGWSCAARSGRARHSRWCSRSSRTKERAMARILIAEDDPLIGSFIEKGLRTQGYSTFVVDDGEQAQLLGMTEDFELLILDMGLPKQSGLQVLTELRARGSKLPVLVLTGRSDRDAALCLDAGADDYMKKPFQFEELLARVRTRLRGSG